MEKIDLKTLLGQFAQSPVEALQTLIPLMLNNFCQNWWIIALSVFALVAARWVLFIFIESMVPNPHRPRRGHVLRRIFLSKITDPQGRLKRLPARKNGKKRVARSKEEERAFYSRRTERASAVASLIKSALNLSFIVSGTVMVFGQLGIVTTSETTGWLLGGVSIALALGFQGLIRDILGGVHILAEDQFGLGDYVDTLTGVSGVVVHIGVRTTRLRGADGTIYHIRHSEMSKIANKTQAAGNILMDVTMTWNDLPEGKKQVQESDLRFAEETLEESLRSVRSTLRAMDRVVKVESAPRVDEEAVHVPLVKIVKAVPTIVPTLGTDTMTNLRAVTPENVPDEEEQTRLRNHIVNAIDRLDKKTTPLFENIEMLGLVTTTGESLTLRIKVQVLHQTSRSQTLSLLRREVFQAFAPHNVSVAFEEVPEGTVI